MILKTFVPLFLILFCIYANLAFALDKSKDCKCRTPAGKRIVNGRPASVLFPWYVTIRGNDNSKNKSSSTKRLLPESYKLSLHGCGGVILNENWILTASACASDQNPKDYVVQFPGNDLVQLYNQDMYVEVERMIPHPNSSARWPQTTWNDIGLIKLARPLNFSSTVQPACLGTTRQELYEGPLKTIGFGSKVPIRIDMNKTGEELTKPQISRYLKETVQFDNTNSSKFCERMAKQDICTKAADKADDSQGTPCVGDDGSPLMWIKNGLSTVVGIYSNNEPVEESNVAGWFCKAGSAFTRVSTYYDWIKSHDIGDVCD